MFPRPSSSAYVCLPCHLRRLVHWKLRPLSTTLSQSSRYSISSPRFLHSSPSLQFTITREFVGYDDLRPKSDVRRPPRTEQHGSPHGEHSELPPTSHNGEGSLRFKAKFRGPRGGQVREDTEALSVKALGKPTKVIVLRDTPRNAEQDGAEQDEKEEDERAETSSKRKTLLETIKEDDAPIDQDSVNQQLDAMLPRTKDPNSGRLIISEKEFFRLCKVITKSYSNEQLDAYITRLNIALPEKASSQPSEVTENLIANKSPDLHYRPWMHKPIHKSKRSKAWRHTIARASTILKKCWKVEIVEEVERIGELVCALPKSGIRLLGAGKPSFLDDIAETRQAKLEIDGSNIRIIADQVSAVHVLEDINRLWSQHAVKVFPLFAKRIPAGSTPGALIAFRPEDVALVSSLTRTTMAYATGSKGKAVAITGVGKDSVDDAFRALMALIDTPLKSVPFSERMVHKIQGSTGTIMQDIPDLVSLPYRQRSSSYGRLCTPTIRPKLALPHPDSESQHTSRKLPAHESDSATEDGIVAEVTAMASQGQWLQLIPSDVTAPIISEPPAWDQFWNTRSCATISVHLGSVVHPTHTRDALNSTPGLLPSNHAKFLHRVPGLSSLLPHLFWDRKNATNILSFRLVHDPWRSHGGPLPDVWLDFEIKSEIKPFGGLQKDVEFKGLRVISRDRRNLVLLPSHAVDLCFKKQEVHHATNTYIDTQPHIKTFIDQTKANIVADNGNLRAPPSVRIHVPFSIAGHGKKAASMRSKKGPNGGKSPKTANCAGTLADYYFAGVEHTQVAGYTFEGCPVRYTSVEAGKLGGKYGDLEIFMPNMGEPSIKDDKSKQREAFVQTILRLVSLVDTAAQGRLERPGRRTTEDGTEHQEGSEQWTPEHLIWKSSQPTATSRPEEESKEGIHEEKSGHANIAPEADLVRVNASDASAAAPPVAHCDGSVQPMEISQPDQRAAASG